MDVYGSLRDELSKLLLSLEKTSSPNLQALKEAKNIVCFHFPNVAPTNAR